MPASSILGRLVLGLSFAYGLFAFFLLMLMSIWKGTFFRRQTEKENLELLLGMSGFLFCRKVTMP
jgi:hypothetical protein